MMLARGADSIEDDPGFQGTPASNSKTSTLIDKAKKIIIKIPLGITVFATRLSEYNQIKYRVQVRSKQQLKRD